MKPNLLLVLIGLLAIGICGTSNAATVVVESAEWMTVDCDLVIRGRVKEANVPGGVFVAIDEVLKGTYEETTINFHTHLPVDTWHENRQEHLFFLNLGPPHRARRDQGWVDLESLGKGVPSASVTMLSKKSDILDAVRKQVQREKEKRSPEKAISFLTIPESLPTARRAGYVDFLWVRPGDKGAEKGTILLDTKSGQTWMLMPHEGKLAWLPVPRVDDPLDRLRELGAKVTHKEGKLHGIDLTNSTISDQDMDFLGTQSTLEHLTLNGCSKVTDAGLVHLRGLTNLKGLALERTKITDAGLTNLKGLTRLDYLTQRIGP